MRPLAIALSLALSSAAFAAAGGLPVKGSALHLTPQAGTPPAACLGAGNVCVWYDSNGGSYKLRQADGTDTLISDQTPKGVPVLYFPGSGAHVDHGPFWKQGAQLANDMYWEAWAQGDPWDASKYIISDGYGGAHALLWSGYSGNMRFTDSTDSSLKSVSYSSGSDLPPPGVFSHVAVMLGKDTSSNLWLTTYVNGIAVGATHVPATYTRTVEPVGGGAGHLDVGGSDHSNFTGWIASVIGFESGLNVGHFDRGPSSNFAAFMPDRRHYGFDKFENPADFMASYTGLRNGYYEDLSYGYDSQGGFAVRMKHPGIIAPSYNLDGSAFHYMGNGIYPTVKYVYNPPFSPAYVDSPPDRGLTPHTPPAGAKIFDSFQRPDQDYAHVNTPTLGKIEYSSIGSLQAWQSGPFSGATLPVNTSAVGIFNGSAVGLYGSGTFAWVQNDSADMTASVKRNTQSAVNLGETGVAVRVQDVKNGYGVAYEHVASASYNISSYSLVRVYKITNGAPTILAQYSVDPSTVWSTLSVTTAGDAITASIDSTALGTVHDPTFQTATGVGLFFSGAPAHNAMPTSSLARYYDFTVK